MKKIVIISLFIVILSMFYSFNDNLVKNKKITLINGYINDNLRNVSINGYLKIDRINLYEIIYDIKSNKNNLNLGLKISYLNPFVILGHSGRGKLAIFNDLDKLHVNDLIEFNYNKKTNYYKIDYIYEKEKDKPLNLDGDLLLVTCKKSGNNTQLVIRAKSVK